MIEWRPIDAELMTSGEIVSGKKQLANIAPAVLNANEPLPWPMSKSTRRHRTAIVAFSTVTVPWAVTGALGYRRKAWVRTSLGRNPGIGLWQTQFGDAEIGAGNCAAAIDEYQKARAVIAPTMYLRTWPLPTRSKAKSKRRSPSWRKLFVSIHDRRVSTQTGRSRREKGGDIAASSFRHYL